MEEKRPLWVTLLIWLLLICGCLLLGYLQILYVGV